MTKQERLQYQVRTQSVQIEELLTRHDIPARVAGGRVRPRAITFDLQAELEAGLERLHDLKQDLMVALGVPEVHIEREAGRLRLELRRPDCHPVDLLDLLAATPDIPPATAVLGLADDHNPVLLNLTTPDISHVWVAGAPGAGKSVLLRTMALSLALVSKQSMVQLLVIDSATSGPGSTSKLMRPLNYLSHMLAPVIDDLDDAVEILNFLVREVNYRKEQQITSPVVVLFIEDLIPLIERGGRPFIEPLTTLLQNGAEAGVRLVLNAAEPTSARLSRLMKAHLSVRLVGQVADAVQARAASGIAACQAEYLLGQGDFLAISHESAIHFQAAHIGDYDLHLCLDRLHRRRQPAVIAQPLHLRPALNEDVTAAGNFTYNGDNGEVAFDED